MNELHTVNRWINAKLAADAQIVAAVSNRIFYEVMPPGDVKNSNANYPAIIYSLHSGDDMQGLGTVRLLARSTYFIRLVSRGPMTTAQFTAANRIDELIGKAVANHAVALTGEEFYISARRLRSLAFSERREQTSETFFYLGGFYRMEVASA